MNDEQYREFQSFVQNTVSQSESRLMAHVTTIEQKLHDLEQRTNGAQSHLDSRANDLRSEFEQVRYSIDQLRSHLKL